MFTAKYIFSQKKKTPPEVVSVSKSTEDGFDQYDIKLKVRPESNNFSRLMEVMSSKIQVCRES